MPDITDEAREAAIATVRRQLHPDAKRNFVMAEGYAHRIVDALLAVGWRPPVSPLTVDAVAELLHDTDDEMRPSHCDRLAEAVVAEFGPLTAHRDALIEQLTADGFTKQVYRGAMTIVDAPKTADALLASGVVADRAEVEREAAAKALEDARELIASMERAFVTSEWGTVIRKLDAMEALSARVAEIREGGTRG